MELNILTNIELNALKKDIEKEQERRKLWSRVRDAIYNYCDVMNETIRFESPSDDYEFDMMNSSLNEAGTIHINY